MHKNLLYILIATIIISGCVSQKKSIKPEKIHEYQEIIAKYADLPDAPFQAKLKNIMTTPDHHDQVQIFYSSTLAMLDLIIFYEQQMERLGWQLIGQSYIQDCLLIYAKPEQLCSILICKDRFSIYMSTKKGA